MAELITGKLSCRKAQHYSTYKKKAKSGKKLEEDADVCVDWGDGYCLKKMAALALKCMRFDSDRRPSVGRVVKELQSIVNADNSLRGDHLAVDRSLRRGELEERNKRELCEGMACGFCGETSNRCIQCSGGSQQHTHCHNCLQSALTRNINRFRYGGVTCLKDGCDSTRFDDEEVASLVSKDVWNSYKSQRNSNLFRSMGRNLINHAEAKFRQVCSIPILHCQAQRCFVL